MATTVKNLIEYLNAIEDKNQPILYQYLLAEHTSVPVEDFENVVEYLENNGNFAEDVSDVFLGWVTEGNDVLLEEEENE